MRKTIDENALELIKAEKLEDIVAILATIKEKDLFSIKLSVILLVSRKDKLALTKSLEMADYLLTGSREVVLLSKSKDQRSAAANLSRFPINKEAAIEAAVARRSGIQAKNLRILLLKVLNSFNKSTPEVANNNLKRKPGEPRKDFKKRVEKIGG